MRAYQWHVLACLALALTSGVAWGQAVPKPKPDVAALEARLVTLAQELAELRKVAAELPAVQQAVADLDARLAGLRQELEPLLRLSAAELDERARLDALDARVADLTQATSALRAGLQAATAPEAVGRGGLRVRYDDGFLLQSEDGGSSLRLRGYGQLRYLARTNEDADDLSESAFSLRRARLAWSGHVVSPSLTYKVMLDFGQGTAQLLDYHVRGSLAAGFMVRAGQFKVPFSRNFVNSADQLSFVERSVATEEFRYDRDIGLLLGWSGLDRRIEFSAGVWNGAGRNVKTNDNIDPLIVARIDLGVLGDAWDPEEGDPAGTKRPSLMLGAAWSFENTPLPAAYGYLSGAPQAPVNLTNRDVNGNGEVDNVRVVQVEADLAFRWRGIGIEAEGYFRREKWGAIGLGQTDPFTPEEDYLGGLAQASYFILPGRLQLGARAAYAEVSPLTLDGRKLSSTTCTDAAGEEFGCALPFADVRTELSGLLACYHRGHAAKVGVMYSFFDWGNRDGPDPDDAGEHRVIVQSQVAF